MPKYKVEITETLQRTVEYEAANEDGAMGAAMSDWQGENIILDSEDFVGVDYKVM